MSGEMEKTDVIKSVLSSEMFERATLCLPNFDTGIVMHRGEEQFMADATRYFVPAENDANEKLIELKSRLRDASTTDFWRILMEGMTDIADAQFAFVTKRLLVDDDKAAVEMPPVGEPGSCLVVEAYYYNDGHGKCDLIRNLSFNAYGAPCGHMRHDKVFLIPERLNDFITHNPNELPFPAEAYMAVPFFAEGKCFAHFGFMWSLDGLRRRRLSWGYLETFMHALEDLVMERMLSGRGFGKKEVALQPAAGTGRVIPHEAVLASQSLKPYARSLSHELRTPMQGVVGMLDVMHATVQEAADAQGNPQLRQIFDSLRENIEMLQDSSKRAVEAADNVVQAYDLNMEVPDTPDLELAENPLRPNHAVNGGTDGSRQSERHDPAPKVPRKRLREADPTDEHLGPSPKHRAIEKAGARPTGEHEDVNGAGEVRADTGIPTPAPSHGDQECLVPDRSRLATPERALASTIDRPSTPGQRPTKLRSLLPSVVQDCLQHGGRPEWTATLMTDLGEDVEVRSRNSRGEVKTKVVRWTVEPSVPAAIPVDERDMSKLISCLLLNALKFTEEGMITLTASNSRNPRLIVIGVEDSGPGIAYNFLPLLFKPFSRQDNSLTRPKDGLGLGLLVAKGLARKIRGDVVCVRSETYGPKRGSQFEIRVPVPAKDGISAPGSPMIHTPTPLVAADKRRDDEEDWRCLRPLPNGTGGRASPEAPAVQDIRPAPPRSSPAPAPAISCADSCHHSTEPAGPAAPVVAPPDPAARPGPKNGLVRPDACKPMRFDRSLATKYPLTFLVVEDNQINRKLLVNMLAKLGYRNVYEAYDGVEAVRQMTVPREPAIDVVLMDLWMPRMDGFEATRRILSMPQYQQPPQQQPQQQQQEQQQQRQQRNGPVTILAVTADVSNEASGRAAEVGMKGLMTKPYKLMDLERSILDYCVDHLVSQQHSEAPELHQPQQQPRLQEPCVS